MNAGQFKKGQIPWNKGTKGIMPKPVNGFQKGNKCWKERPVGSERKTRDGIDVKHGSEINEQANFKKLAQR